MQAISSRYEAVLCFRLAGLLLRNLNEVTTIPRPQYLRYIHNMVAKLRSLTATQLVRSKSYQKTALKRKKVLASRADADDLNLSAEAHNAFAQRVHVPI